MAYNIRDYTLSLHYRDFINARLKTYQLFSSQGIGLLDFSSISKIMKLISPLLPHFLIPFPFAMFAPFP